LKAHTDSKGTDEYNQVLSNNRSMAAKNYLVNLGIDATRISTEAGSKSAPVAANTEDDSGRKFNRRVELYIKDKAGNEVCKSVPPTIPSGLKSN
jgi:outer membrane protein OmpA-like peptidoglycan-associated protein